MESMKKRLQNFWYYYKIPTLIILAVLAAGLYFLSQRETIQSDYSVAIVSPRGLSGEQLAKIKTVMEQTGQDRNGDNAVTVMIRVFRFAIGEDGQDTKEVAGLDADLVGKESGIFFTEDPKRFEEVTNGIGKAADAVPVSDVPMLADCGIDDLYFLVRSDADQSYTEMFSALTD